MIEAKTAEDAEEKAKEIGHQQEGDSDSDGTLRWNDIPAEWIYKGVRKLISIQEENATNNQPFDGVEITYSTLEFSNQKFLDKFLDCDETLATILD